MRAKRTERRLLLRSVLLCVRSDHSLEMAQRRARDVINSKSSAGIVFIDTAWLYAAARLSLREPFSIPHFDALCVTLRGARLSDSKDPPLAGGSDSAGGGSAGDSAPPYDALCSWLLEAALDLVRPDLQRPPCPLAVGVVRNPSSGRFDPASSPTTAALRSLPVCKSSDIGNMSASSARRASADNSGLLSEGGRRASASSVRRASLCVTGGGGGEGRWEADRRFAYLVENVCRRGARAGSILRAH